MGIVRGASQRVVKLETNGRPDDELTAYVEGILNELITGQGVYGLVLADCRTVPVRFGPAEGPVGITSKKEIGEVRQGARADALIDSSEKLF